MPARRMKAVWIPPGGSAVDVSERLLKHSTITKGVADPNKVLAFVAGDVTVELSNFDGFFNTAFGTSQVANLTEWPQLDHFRQEPKLLAWQRVFRGFVEGNNSNLLRKQRRLSTTVLGGRRLLDLFDAEKYIRRGPGIYRVSCHPAAF
jgi:hypothetical protein